MFPQVWPLLCIISVHQIHGSNNLIRGVSLQRMSLYDPLKDFTCFDGSLTIPFTYVNDDYCDCYDGSDEPGTAACPKGTFFCTNKGYVSKYIPSSFVNDGICDCCDASDEYSNPNCTNTCEELGQEARREAERRSQMTIEGSRVRSQMIASAKRILADKQERVVVLENEKAEAVRLKDEAEALKKSAEERENAALEAFRVKEEEERALRAEEEREEELNEAKSLFETYDSNGDGILQDEEIRTREIFDQNKDSVVSEDEIKGLTDSGDINLDVFIKDVFPKLRNVLLMNRLKIPPEDKAGVEGDSLQNEQKELNEDEKEQEWNQNEQDPDDEENEEDEEEAQEQPVQEQYKETQDSKYDNETAKIIEEANQARSQYESASRSVQDLDRELTHVKEFLSKDYGSEDEFAPLDGQCFTFTDREYSYKLCPFDQVTQAGKSGGSETRLGTWAGWVDKNYNTMLYDKGQSCWNGPQRSTKVMVSCGLENQVVAAAEPNKCEYVLEFHTPAACRLKDRNKDAHDEL